MESGPGEPQDGRSRGKEAVPAGTQGGRGQRLRRHLANYEADTGVTGREHSSTQSPATFSPPLIVGGVKVVHTETPRVGRGRTNFRSQEFIDSPKIRTAGRINAAARPTMQGAGKGQEAAGEEIQAPAPGSGAV